MHISLTPRLEAFVKSRVESGLYNNASEVLREALRHRMEAEREPEFTEEYREWVDGKLEEAERDVEQGKISAWSYGEFMDEFHARHNLKPAKAA